MEENRGAQALHTDLTAITANSLYSNQAQKTA